MNAGPTLFSSFSQSRLCNSLTQGWPFFVVVVPVKGQITNGFVGHKVSVPIIQCQETV